MGLIKIQQNTSTKNNSKSILQKASPLIEEKQILYQEAGCLKTTFSTGFMHDDKPVVAPPPPSFNQQTPIEENEDSVIDSMDTGFGENNTISQDCPKPQYKTHLFKENHLSEFKSETEKALVRYNIGVYSKTEVHDLVSHIISDGTASFVTKEQVEDMMDQLDFVDSTLRAYAIYDIPTKLFPL